MINKNIQLKVLFFKDGQSWIAQGLEYDMVAQGRTIQEAQKSFERVFVTNIVVNIKNKIKPLSQFKKAPKIFFKMFENAEQLVQKENENLINNLKNIPSTVCIPEYQLNDRRVYA